ncbi:sulfatase-like hydrolase/transferase [Halobacterium hubeiense]|uniref:sulfatase-like hydrolase/transferase n=1 Tax=Halobacterium hubeiense TaxID=1407499 RepID=UPI003C74EE4F
MDAVWIVLDSLSFEATRSGRDGPDPMPRLQTLAEEHAVTFERAYAPGPASPSSHAAFLTGEYPSVAGMHDAHPYFDGRVPTIADRLDGTHRSHIVSVNPFLFAGLDESFDVSKDLAARDYMVFEGTADPRQFGDQTDLTGLQKFVGFLREGGTPLRNIVNGIRYRIWRRQGNDFIPESIENEAAYQYAGAMNDAVRSAVSSFDPTFVLANYMDVHPPLSASEEAIQRFASDWDDLPVGVRAEDTDEYETGAIEALYRAAAWDLDRQVSELVEELIEDDTFVIVTADHGPRFGRGEYLTERRLHVPLFVFAPDEAARTVEHTVSLRSLPRTTMTALTGSDGEFEGEDLLTVEDDRTVVTEYLHREDGNPGPVSIPDGKESAHRNLLVRRGDSRLRLDDGEETDFDGDPAEREELRAAAEDLIAADGGDGERQTFDRDTEERLEDLGYL